MVNSIDRHLEVNYGESSSMHHSISKDSPLSNENRNNRLERITTPSFVDDTFLLVILLHMKYFLQLTKMSKKRERNKMVVNTKTPRINCCTKIITRSIIQGKEDSKLIKICMSIVITSRSCKYVPQNFYNSCVYILSQSKHIYM